MKATTRETNKSEAQTVCVCGDGLFFCFLFLFSLSCSASCCSRPSSFLCSVFVLFPWVVNCFLPPPPNPLLCCLFQIQKKPNSTARHNTQRPLSLPPLLEGLAQEEATKGGRSREQTGAGWGVVVVRYCHGGWLSLSLFGSRSLVHVMDVFLLRLSLPSR
jgi:hypothetical protein